jgi:hypothetical protein
MNSKTMTNPQHTYDSALVLRCGALGVFGWITPGKPIILTQFSVLDDLVWSKVSGHYAIINDREYAVFRFHGNIWLRLDCFEQLLTTPVVTTFALKNNDYVAVLTLRIDSRSFQVEESVPESFRNDPTADHISMEDALWTYRVHNVLRDQETMRSYWGFAGW